LPQLAATCGEAHNS